MPTQRPPLITGEYYHVYNRGVDKRDIFADDQDRYRMVHDLYEFNDERDVTNLARLSEDEYALHRMPNRPRKPRKLLVDIIAWAFMPNHYHLLLRQRTDGGISLYMKKLGAGYTVYFNERHKRSGSLFQGRYKVKLVGEDSYTRHLVSYIHANPLPTLAAPSDIRRYRWSSYQDYAHIRNNFPSLIHWDTVSDLALSRGETHEDEVRNFTTRREAKIRKLTFPEN